LNPLDPNVQSVEAVAQALADYYALEKRFEQRGFKRDVS
jgi:hypothetical protein